MSAISDVQRKVQEFASENATTLLTAGGVVGVVGTAVLAGRAGYKYAKIVDAIELERIMQIPEEERGDIERENARLTKLEKAQAVGIHFVPPVVTGGATIAAIILSHRMSAQKAAALAAAYGLSRQQLEEYKEKVSEKLTGPKRETVEAELAQERANQSPGAGSIVIVEGGDVLCFDQPTGRYFKSTMEKIRSAVNSTNEHILQGREYASANFFYEELGLDNCTWGDEVGFNVHNLVELTISAIVSPADRQTPCIAIDFKRLPTEDYIDRAHE
jgi:hypothetical protein